jgi:hypothetical protein
MPEASRRTAQPLFPRWVLVAVPAVVVAALLVTLAARLLDSDGGDGGGARSDATGTAEVAGDLDEQAAAASAAPGEEPALLARRVAVLADLARGRVPPEPPDWERLGVAPGSSLQGAGVGFEAQAASEQRPDRMLRWLVLAEAERARVLGLDDLAAGLERVVLALGGGRDAG